MKKLIINILFLVIGFSGVGQITVNTNFKPNIAAPIDNRVVITNLADTSTVSFKYEGMLIYCAVLNKFYYYETYWKELASETLIDSYVSNNGYLTGVGTSNYLPVWGGTSYLTYSSGTGFVKVTNGNISYDNSTYLTSEVDGSTSNEIQRLDTFEIYETNKLRISLEGDGQPYKTVTLPAGSDTQDLSLDSLSRVFTLTLTNGGTVKWKDTDTNSGGTVTSVTASTPLTSSGGTAPEIGITMLKDLVLQSPLSGGSYNNILPGSDSDVLVGIDTISLPGGVATRWQLSQLSFSDTQDLSLDSLNRVFSLALVNGGTVKWRDIDTQLSESQVDAYVGNNGYLTSEVDGSASNEVQTLAADSTSTTIGITSSINNSRVHFNVLKSEIDGSITNEIQKLDTFEIYDTNKLRISLQNDNEAFKTVTLPAGSDTQDLSLDSLNRVFSLALVNGGTVKWKDSDSELPTQTGQTGKYLQTNGTSPSWQTAISGTASSNKLPVGSGATSITTSSGTGFVKVTNGDVSYDNSTYGTGTVTGVSGTNPIVSSGGATPAISINSDTLTSWRTKQNQGVMGYNDKINSAGFTGTSTKTLTLTQQDGGTVTAQFTDIDTDTKLTQEEVQDYVGAMMTGNTENNMNVDYQDSDGTIDFNITMDKDIVANAPLSGGANNVLIGNDSDVTISVDTTSAAGLATQDDIKSKLKGQRWCLFGDSFSDGITGEYGAVVKTLLSLGTTETHATSGHKISQQLTVLNNLLSSDPTHFDDVEIVSLLVGANDFAQNTTLGTRASAAGSASYAGYLKDFIETLLWTAPTIKFFIMTPPEADGAGVPYQGTNTAGWTMKELAVLINQICTDYSIQCIDLYSYSGFNYQTIGTYTSDGLHPNTAGSAILGEIVARAFEGMNNGQTMQDSGSTISYTDKAVLHGNSGALGQDATNFGWDYTNKLLNIGTTTNTAWYGLEFKSGTTLEGFLKHKINTSELMLSSGRYAGWGGTIKFNTNDTTRITIGTLGQVLIHKLAGADTRFATVSVTGELGASSLSLNGLNDRVALWSGSVNATYSNYFTYDRTNEILGMLGSNKLIFAIGTNANTSNPWASFNDQSGYLNQNWFSKFDGTNWVKTTGVGGGWASRFRNQNGTFYFSNATADGAVGSTITWQDILSLSNTGMTALSMAGSGSALAKVSDAGLFSRATAGTDYDPSNTNEIQNLGYTASSRTITIDGSGSTDATLPLFTSTEAGLVPLSGGGTTNFLRADGTWAAAGGGSVTTDKDLVTTAPLAGGQDNILVGSDSDVTLSIANAKADAGTKGAATFTGADFNDNAAGTISLDYVNGATASATVKGYLAPSDFINFSNKVTGTGNVNYMPRWSGSNTLSYFGNVTVADDATNINFNTPGRNLRFNTAGANVMFPGIAGSTSTKVAMIGQTTGQLYASEALYYNATEYGVQSLSSLPLVLNKAGNNVGVGKLPAVYFDVNGAGSFVGGLNVSAYGSGFTHSYLSLQSTSNTRGAGTYLFGSGSTWFCGANYNDFDTYFSINYRNTTNDYATAQTTYAKFIVKKDGKVGVGTIYPTSAVTGVGDIELQVPSSAANTNYLKIGTYTTGTYGSFIKAASQYTSNLNTTLTLGVSNAGTPLDALAVSSTGQITVPVLASAGVKMLSVTATGQLQIASSVLYDESKTNEGYLGTNVTATPTVSAKLQGYNNTPTATGNGVTFQGGTGIGINTTDNTNGGTINIVNTGVTSLNGKTGAIISSIGRIYDDAAYEVTSSGDSINFTNVVFRTGYIDTVHTITGLGVHIPQDYFKIKTGGEGYYELNLNCSVKRKTSNNHTVGFLFKVNATSVPSHVILDLNDANNKWVSYTAIVYAVENDKIYVRCDPASYSVDIDQISFNIKKIE